MKKLILIALAIGNFLVVGLVHAFEGDSQLIIPSDVESQIEHIDLGDVNCGIDTDGYTIGRDTSR